MWFRDLTQLLAISLMAFSPRNRKKKFIQNHKRSQIAKTNLEKYDSTWSDYITDFHICYNALGFPGGVSNKELTCQCRSHKRLRFAPWVGKDLAPHSSILAWRIPCTVEPGGLQSIGSHRVGHHWSNLACMQSKMGSKKDRNGRDLIEAEDIKKRWQEHTELYKTDLHDPDNHDGVIIHLEPDIMECEVKWALGSITVNKASGGDGIPVELFQILKDDAVKVLHSICQQIWKTQQWPQDWKRSVFIPIPKKGNPKECSN